MSTGSYRIGAGSGFAGDRTEPARILAERARPDALVFECLAERTIALAQQRMTADRRPGYDPRFLDRLADVLDVTRGVTVMTNAGAADPVGLARQVAEMVRDGGHDRRVAAVVGDDVASVLPPDAVLSSGETVEQLGERLVSANAYIGATAAVEALQGGADIVVTGRMGDAALFAAPVLTHFGWSADDPRRAADTTLIGHLLECAGQLTGGYFDDGRGRVPDVAHLGFPFADVDADGGAVYGKADGTGGLIDTETVVEQLLYEIDDPRAYKTPDVTLDLTQVRIEQHAADRVRVAGAVAAGRPAQLKVSVGVRDGLLAVGSIGYAGLRALARAESALRIVQERWESVHGRDPSLLRVDLQGLNSLRSWLRPDVEPPEVRARIALRTFDAHEARLLSQEVEALYTNGPAGGGGVETNVKETTGIVSTFIDRELVHPRVRFAS